MGVCGYRKLLLTTVIMCIAFMGFSQQKNWVFIMAGQSNMAGRGLVEAVDTIANSRIKTIDKDGKLIPAREPLHFYEPTMAGLDCGKSFAEALLPNVPEDVTIVMIPTAVGGSSIIKWLEDSVHRGVPLWTNFTEKVAMARKLGEIKGIIWHQGEADANAKGIPLYQGRLKLLFSRMRKSCHKKRLPILMGELGYFSKTVHEQFMTINRVMHEYAATDSQSAVVVTSDLEHKGDNLHFNSAGQRELGRRYAQLYLKKFNH